VTVRLLLVDDDRSSRDATASFLQDVGYDVVTAPDGEQALRRLGDGIAVVVTDLAMPRLDGLGLLAAVRERAPHLPVIMLTGQGSEKLAVQALKNGAFHYLTKPVDPDELLSLVAQACDKFRLAVELAALRSDRAREGGFAGMIGRSPAMQAIFAQIVLVADTRTTVLVQGESGTGKELVARALHERSGRRRAPFVAVNCAALPPNLVESELFGHTRGAFTGATAAQAGTFRAAHGGTLLIDEIGEMPLELQGRLLRVLETQQVSPVGSDRPVDVDVRIVAATNRRLEADVAAGRFREDLFYRLNVVTLDLPPLRERREDIPLLARAFCDRLAADLGRPVREITPEALRRLAAFAWPGNVRQLRNVLESAIVMSTRDSLDVGDLPAAVRGESGGPPVPAVEIAAGATLAEMERAAIAQALAAENGNRTAASRRLGISVRTLQRKIRRYDLEPEGRP